MQTGSKKTSGEISNQPIDRIQRIENGLPPISLGDNEPLLQLTLPKLMEIYNVPGLSVAVIDNFTIAWAKGYGVAEQGTTIPVTPQTLFQAGSVSKPVAAVGALFLVDNGKLLLDEDLNQKLTTWKIPDNEFTRDQKVTLRRILGHSAGLTIHFFPGYSVNEPIPSLVQILDGERPAKTAPIRVEDIPGNKWRYSGGGLVVAQQLMIDVTGKPFPQLMKETVFAAIGMNESTYEQPLPPERSQLAASGTLWDGQTVRGKWHIYPEMAAAGLWTTASDLAKFAIEIALSQSGKSNRVLSPAMIHEMLTPQMEHVTELALGNQDHPDRMGLGFFLGDAARPDLFGHIGDDEGFQAMLMMYGESGQGVAIMANSANGILLGDYLIENIAKEYSWNHYVPADRPRLGADAVLFTVAQAKGTQAAIEKYRDLKKMAFSRYTPNENTLLILGYLLLSADKPQDAVEIMTLQVKEHPTYWNGYSTLATLYMMAGETALAIQNYEKSIELKPDNPNAIETLKRLRNQQ